MSRLILCYLTGEVYEQGGLGQIIFDAFVDAGLAFTIVYLIMAA
jgi:hypothetical protein